MAHLNLTCLSHSMKLRLIMNLNFKPVLKKTYLLLLFLLLASEAQVSYVINKQEGGEYLAAETLAKVPCLLYFQVVRFVVGLANAVCDPCQVHRLILESEREGFLASETLERIVKMSTIALAVCKISKLVKWTNAIRNCMIQRWRDHPVTTAMARKGVGVASQWNVFEWHCCVLFVSCDFVLLQVSISFQLLSSEVSNLCAIFTSTWHAAWLQTIRMCQWDLGSCCQKSLNICWATYGSWCQTGKGLGPEGLMGLAGFNLNPAMTVLARRNLIATAMMMMMVKGHLHQGQHLQMSVWQRKPEGNWALLALNWLMVLKLVSVGCCINLNIPSSHLRHWDLRGPITLSRLQRAQVSGWGQRMALRAGNLAMFKMIDAWHLAWHLVDTWFTDWFCYQD